MHNTEAAGVHPYVVGIKEQALWDTRHRGIQMTVFSLTAGTTHRERASFVPTAFFAEFLAGAREGLDLERRYHTLSRKSTPDLAKMGLERNDIAQAALTGKTR
jgi:hypothetical protein